MFYVFKHFEKVGIVTPLEVKAFNAMTMAEINAVCNAGKAADYVADGTWTIGDANSNATYGSYSGVRLVHVLTDTQRGSSYYNTDGHIVVEFVNTITTSAYMSSNVAQQYFNGTLHTMCNSTIYGSLNSDFKSVLKPWTCIVGKENTTSSAGAYGTYSQSVYLAAPAATEVGSSNDYNSDENNATFCFTYYSTDSQNRRKKSGAYAYWCLRSPSYYKNGSYLAYHVDNSGVIRHSSVDHSHGVAPIAVI